MINKINFSGNVYIAKHLRHSINKKDLNLIKSYSSEKNCDIFVNSKRKINYKRSIYDVIIVPEKLPGNSYSDFIDTEDVQTHTEE